MKEYIKDKKADDIGDILEEINQKLGNKWLALVKGLLYGFGSILGAGLAIILIGWFLNIVGVIPAFKQQADEWRNIFKQTQNNQSFLPGETETVEPTK